MYNTLQPISGNLNEAEREALMEDFLRINYQLLDIHEHIEKVTALKAKLTIIMVPLQPRHGQFVLSVCQSVRFLVFLAVLMSTRHAASPHDHN